MKKKLIYPCLALASFSVLIGCKGGGEKQDIYYTVTFNSQGGSEIPSQRIKEGEHAVKPETSPTRGDDIFNCWVIDPKNIQEFNFESTPITSDITLYAHYYSDYQLEGLTNIDYNENLETQFNVVDKEKKTATGFKFGLYVNDVTTQDDFGINEDTGLLTLYDKSEGKPYSGYVYAYKLDKIQEEEYVKEFCYKPFNIASFSCFTLNQIGTSDEYEAVCNDKTTKTTAPRLRISIPSTYYDETNKQYRKITKVNGKFATLLNQDKNGKYIYLDDSIKEIGDDAFGVDDSHSSEAILIHMSTSIEKIGKRAFKNTRQYPRDAALDFSNTKLVSIDDEAFCNCNFLNKKIILPETLTLLGSGAFHPYNQTEKPKSIEFKDSSSWISNNSGICQLLDLSDINHNVTLFCSDDHTELYSGVQKFTINKDAATYKLNSTRDGAIVTGVDMDKIEEFIGHISEVKQKAITIPSTIDIDGGNFPVVEVADKAFKDKKGLNNVYLPDTITSIGNEAFSGCTNLNSIFIPKSVNRIGSNVFDNCPNICSMRVDPKNTTYANFSSVDGYNKGDAIYSKDYKILYYGCRLINSKKIPGNLVSIMPHAFYGIHSTDVQYSGITNDLEFPETLIYIGDSAFYNAYGGTSLNNTRVTFKASNNLWTVKKGETTIGGIICNDVYKNAENVFKNYSDYEWYFNKSGSDGLTFVDSITTKTATVSCGECKDNDVIIPDIHNNCTVKKIVNEGFKDKNNIKSVSLPEGLEDFGYSAFENCTSLTQIIIPKTVNSFGMYHFNKEHPLIPITSNDVFKGCSSLTKVYMEDYNSSWDYGVYIWEPTSPKSATIVFNKEGTFRFTGDPIKDAKIFTDYTSATTERYTQYVWKKTGTY